jgi:Flp pilus assembly protein CpaB
MSYSVRNIAIALVLALAAAALVITYTGRVKEEASSQQATTPVLVATTEIPAGTPVSEAIEDGSFAVEQVVQRDVVPNALPSTDQLVTANVTRTVITPHQQVTGALFAPSTAVRIPERIKSTTRAMQIALDANAVLYGTLQAGDRVDLVGTYKVASGDEGSEERYVGRIIKDDVEVLQAQAADPEADAPQAGTATSVTLALDDTVVAKVAFTLQAGVLHLVARPTAGADTTDQKAVADICSVLGDGLNTFQVQTYIPECGGRIG